MSVPRSAARAAQCAAGLASALAQADLDPEAATRPRLAEEISIIYLLF